MQKRNILTNYIKSTFLIVISLFLGCAGTLRKAPLEKHDSHFILREYPKHGIVYFYKEKKGLGSIYIKANGKRIGALNNGTYFVYLAEPGQNIFSVEDNLRESPSQTINIEPNRDYYFRGSIKRGFWDAVPYLERVGEILGRGTILGLTYATLEKPPASTNTIEAYEEFLKQYPARNYMQKKEIKWFIRGKKNDNSPDYLFILDNGYSFNGELADDFIYLIDSSGERKKISSNDIISIYAIGLETKRLELKENKIKGTIIGEIKIRTKKGGLIIDPKNLAFYHSHITRSANEISRLEIIENQKIMFWESKKTSDSIKGTIIPEYWISKVFTLNNPRYSPIIDDPFEPIEFSFDFQKHSDISDNTLIIFRMIILKEGGFGGFETLAFDYTPLSISIGETKKIDLNITLAYKSFTKSLKGKGYLELFVVPNAGTSYRFLTDKIKIFRTISNVLRLPIEIKNNKNIKS
ncbi:MAG: DUF2846 domain-containing protein [bacterium]